jgi:hypothetical protein
VVVRISLLSGNSPPARCSRASGRRTIALKFLLPYIGLKSGAASDSSFGLKRGLVGQAGEVKGGADFTPSGASNDLTAKSQSEHKKSRHVPRGGFFCFLWILLQVSSAEDWYVADKIYSNLFKMFELP